MSLERDLDIVLSGSKPSPLAEMVYYWNKAGVPLREEDFSDFPDVEVSDLTPKERRIIRSVFQEIVKTGLTADDRRVIRQVLDSTLRNASDNDLDNLTDHIIALLPGYRAMVTEPEEDEYEVGAGEHLFSRLQDIPWSR